MSLGEDILLSDCGKASVCRELTINGVGGITDIDVSGIVSDGGACVCVDCRVVGSTSGSAGTMVGFAVSGPLSRSSLQVASFSDIKRMGGSLDNPSMWVKQQIVRVRS